MDYKKTISKLYAIMLLTSTLIGVTGCNEKEDNSLLVMDTENNQLLLIYPNEYIGTKTITGGIQPYSVSCESDILKVYMGEYPNTFNYEILGIGDAQIKVSDSSGQSVLLDVQINYREYDFEIAAHDVIIKSKKMNDEELDEIKNKALTNMPVKIGGGYKLIYTELNSGTLYVYKDKFGEKYSEGSFSIKYETNGNDENTAYHFYNLLFDNSEHNYILNIAPRSRASENIVTTAFYENILEKYHSEYPELEELFTVQVIKNQ